MIFSFSMSFLVFGFALLFKMGEKGIEYVRVELKRSQPLLIRMESRGYTETQNAKSNFITQKLSDEDFTDQNIDYELKYIII